MSCGFIRGGQSFSTPILNPKDASGQLNTNDKTMACDPHSILQSAKASLGPPLTPGQIRIFHGWSCNSSLRLPGPSASSPLIVHNATCRERPTTAIAKAGTPIGKFDIAATQPALPNATFTRRGRSAVARIHTISFENPPARWYGRHGAQTSATQSEGIGVSPSDGNGTGRGGGGRGKDTAQRRVSQEASDLLCRSVDAEAYLRMPNAGAGHGGGGDSARRVRTRSAGFWRMHTVDLMAATDLDSDATARRPPTSTRPAVAAQFVGDASPAAGEPLRQLRVRFRRRLSASALLSPPFHPYERLVVPGRELHIAAVTGTAARDS
jgi:hypothetical protein